MYKGSTDANVTLESLCLAQKNCTSKSICLDYFGNEIFVGDYVIGHSGIPLKEAREGYVVNISEYECGSFIRISTPGGRVIAHSDYPHDYIVKPKD